MKSSILLALFFLTTASLAVEALFSITNCRAEPADPYVIVPQGSNHVVAFGSLEKKAEVLDSGVESLDEHAFVTIRNDNGILQATELGSVVYQNGNTLIVRLF